MVKDNWMKTTYEEFGDFKDYLENLPPKTWNMEDTVAVMIMILISVIVILSAVFSR